MNDNMIEQTQDAPPTEASAGPTEIGLPLLAAHAYTDEPDEPQSPPNQSWRHTCAWGMVVVLLCAAAAYVVIMAGWIAYPGASVSNHDTPTTVIGAGELPNIDMGPSTFVMPTVIANHLVAPTVTELPANTHDEDFLTMLATDWNRHNWHIANPAQVIASAHAVCTQMAQPDHPTRLQVAD